MRPVARFRRVSTVDSSMVVVVALSSSLRGDGGAALAGGATGGGGASAGRRFSAATTTARGASPDAPRLATSRSQAKSKISRPPSGEPRHSKKVGFAGWFRAGAQKTATRHVSASTKAVPDRRRKAAQAATTAPSRHARVASAQTKPAQKTPTSGVASVKGSSSSRNTALLASSSVT